MKSITPFSRLFSHTRIAGVVVLALLATGLSGSAYAQDDALAADYRVVAGDRLIVSVPQRPDLDRQLTVLPNGSVTMPLVGDVEVAGLTAEEISRKLLQAMRDYYPSVSDVSIEIQASGSFQVYVIGEVGTPGKYVFRAPPNLWEAIREAGGPRPTASMDNVRIVQDLSKGGNSRVVNVQNELDRGNVDNLPRLEDGDTVVLPLKEAQYGGQHGIQVFGAVTTPGIYRLQGDRNLMSALLLAGGPTPDASLDNVRVVRPDVDGTTQTMEVNLKRFLETGDPTSNPGLKPGDTVSVSKQNRLAYLLKNEAGFLLGIITTGVTTTLLIIELNR
jgi:polysaccharide export outer membrane protein